MSFVHCIELYKFRELCQLHLFAVRSCDDKGNRDDMKHLIRSVFDRQQKIWWFPGHRSTFPGLTLTRAGLLHCWQRVIHLVDESHQVVSVAPWCPEKFPYWPLKLQMLEGGLATDHLYTLTNTWVPLRIRQGV